jgi:hypothetical protein
MSSDPLGPKDPEEIKVITLPFERELNGVAIASVTYVRASAYKGVDPSAAGMVLGAPTFAGTNVSQRLQGGLDSVVYKIRAKVVDVQNNVHVATALVEVKNLGG